MVDIRSRDGERVGKMRVDEVAEFFYSLMPEKSKSYKVITHSNIHLYAKAWKP